MCLKVLLLLLLAGLPLAAWGGEGAPPQFQKQYQELRDLARRSPFGVPLSVYSEERNGRVTAEVHGIIEHPFGEFKAVLSTPASWCEYLPLNLNVKACTVESQPRDTHLTLYIGRKYYQPPEDAWSQAYRFVVQTRESGSLSVTLSAPEGLFGTTAHRIQLEADGVEGRTVVDLRLSYVRSTASKLMTALYLGTLGWNKVGFSREDTNPGSPPVYVKGLRGMLERTIMRYYLALEAFLDTRSMPVTQRFETCINAVYDLMEQYPVQLHEMEKAEYLDAKRREREDQLRLQQKIDTTGPRPMDR